MKKSFSLIELVMVLVISGILYSTVSFSVADTALNQAANQIVKHINYTRHLALIDNKMQYYPLNSSATEMNRSKYWFKQWWQIRFSKTRDKQYWYEIFSDIPVGTNKADNFDRTGYKPVSNSAWNETFARNSNNHKYLIGRCGGSNYPACDDIENKLNLTRTYSIKKIIYTNFSKRLLFDNYGNVYLTEGKKGDGDDINPYDKDERAPLLKIAKIILCQDDNCNKSISVCIYPKLGISSVCK